MILFINILFGMLLITSSETIPHRIRIVTFQNRFCPSLFYYFNTIFEEWMITEHSHKTNLGFSGFYTTIFFIIILNIQICRMIPVVILTNELFQRIVCLFFLFIFIMQQSIYNFHTTLYNRSSISNFIFIKCFSTTQLISERTQCFVHTIS